MRGISVAGLSALKRHEGLRLDAYPDPASGGAPWTIGYGHTRGVQPGDRITQPQAEAFLLDDLQWVYAAINGNVQAPLTQAQFDALCSLIYNIGASAFEKSTLLRKLNAGDFSGAAVEFDKWNQAAGKIMPGLVSRRAAERAMFAGSSQTAPTKEQPMPLPFAFTALPMLMEAAPALIRLFGSSPQSEKNAKAAEAVAEIAKTVTGQPTVEGAVQEIRNNPEVAAQFREKIHLSMGELIGGLEAVNAMEEKSISAAREYNAAEPMFLNFGWLQMKFIHLLSLIFMSFSGSFVWKYWPDLTPELKGAVITLMIIAGYVGVKDYWMSSSAGSTLKTEMMNRGRER